MRKELLFVAAIFLLPMTMIKGQQSKISFENSEGYTVGNINNQKGWKSYHSINEEYVDYDGVLVSDLRKTDGVNSLLLGADSDFAFKGVSNNLSETFEKTRISMDVFIEPKIDDLRSDILFSVISKDEAESHKLGTINFSFDDKFYAGIGDMLGEIPDLEFEDNKWYNIVFEVDHTTKSTKLFVNNEEIFEGNYDDVSNKINALDFFIFDLGTGFNVDNIVIENKENMSVKNINTINFSIAPNPTTDYLNVKSDEKINSIEIIDANGRKISEDKSNLKINVKHLNSGTYFVKINTDKGSITKKFIKL
ncbi:T9SS type A sorting domain-containing protein [Chryseobacterium sp. T1]